MNSALASKWPERFKTAAIYATPIVVALIGGMYAYASKDQEVRVRYVELAITILREPPKAETKHIREWAITVVNRYSETPLKTEAQKELFDFPLPTNLYSTGVSALRKLGMELNLSEEQKRELRRGLIEQMRQSDEESKKQGAAPKGSNR